MYMFPLKWHFIQLYSFLKDGGMPLDSIYTWINEQLSWGNYTPPVRVTEAGAKLRQETGLKALWNDLTSLIPTAELLSWYVEMLAVNPDMQVMEERLEQKTTETIRDQLHTCEKYLLYR